MTPRYPVYVPSKGRHGRPLTATFLSKDRIPFFWVVEPQERAEYEAAREGLPHPEMCTLLELDRNNGGLIYARNFCKDHSRAAGDVRHWQIDDNIRRIVRWEPPLRIRVHAGIGLRCCEDFVDRYTNVAIAGLAYEMFGIGKQPPFNVNVHVYSCTLVLNDTPFRWRLRYNDDTDMCLQVLAAGWCTVQVNAFLTTKLRTMVVKGGNTDDLYHGDGRLVMARSLERVWPHVVRTDRRYGRPQHVVDWKRFKTPLKRRTDIDWSKLRGTNEYGMKLVAKGRVTHPELRRHLQRKRRQGRQRRAR